MERQVAENQPAGTAIGAPVTLVNPVGAVTYSLAGSDAAGFSIDSDSGRLRTTGPLDYETRKRYAVTVTATDDNGSHEITVSIQVSDLEEPGVVTVTPTAVRAGQVIRGRLTDPDGGVIPENGVWRWSVSADGDRDGRYINVAGGLPGTQPVPIAEATAFTPSSDHAGKYLKVSVQYSDRRSPREFSLDNTAEWVSAAPIAAAEVPQPLTVRTVVSGLTIPWDVAFTPDGTMLFTERAGSLQARFPDGRLQRVNAEFGRLYTSFAVGLMSLAVDPDFNNNRRFYTCEAQEYGTEVQVISWTMDETYSSATRVDDPLVGGIDFKRNGWHGGCRILFGPDGYLWVTTGDGQIAGTAQNLNSLAGKVLRVNAQTGGGAPDNPFSDSDNPSQKTPVYSYGHRNPQGLAFRPNTKQVWVVGHGPDYDDEINLIVSGGNYGWDPAPPYNEKVPMTDLDAFPDAIVAKWRSGFPAIAPSGAVFLDGEDWGAWNGRLAVAVLKQKYLKVFEFAEDGTFISETTAPELDQHFGRLRSPVLGPDGALYITTSNGSGKDRILQVFGPGAPRLSGPDDVVSYHHLGTDPVATFAPHNLDASATWTLSGQDAAVFDISSTGILSFRVSPRVDAPADADSDNIYHVLVTVTDGSGSAHLAVKISVERTMADISIVAGGGVNEGDDATFTVTASPPPTADLEVGVTVAQSGDYGVTTGSRTVTIPPSGSYTLTVATADDTADEADGSVSVTVDAGSGYTVSTSAGTATVAVSDDDVLEVGVIGGSGVTEGGDAVFTVSASPAPTAPLIVNVTVVQTGDFGVSAGSRSVTVPTSGSVTVTVSTSDDEVDELDGSVSVTVDSGDGYTVSTLQGSASVVVSDDDVPPPVGCGSADALAAEARGNHDALPNTAANRKERNDWWRAWIALSGTTGTFNTPLTAAEAKVLESGDSRWTRFRAALECLEGTLPLATPEVSVTAGGGITEGGDAVFTVLASPAPSASLSVAVTVAQTGDYGATTGTRTVTVGTGGTATVTVSTSDDEVDELDGSVSVTVDSGDGYTVSTLQGSASVVVSDDDVPPPVGCGSADALAAEARGNHDALPNTAANRKERNDWWRAWIALSGTTGTFNTPLTAAEAKVLESGDSRWTRFRAALECLEGTLPLATPEVSVTAGGGITEGANASFTVTADPVPSAPLIVNVTVVQTGDFGVSAGSRSVTVPTSGSVTVTVSTSDDDVDELDGSVSVSVDSGDGYTVSTLQGSASVVVSDDDDPPPVVSVTGVSGITEGANASFTVTADPVPSAPLIVNVTVVQTGDFGVSAGSRSVTVPTSGSVTVTVSTSDDDVDELDGSVSVSVDSGDGYTVSTLQGSASVVVSDDDDPPPVVVPEVSVTAGNGITEGGDASFTVSASPAPTAPLTVNVTVAQSGDFGAPTGTRTVTVGTGGNATVTVSTSDDDVDEPDGSVTATVKNGDGYTVSGSQGSATVNVADDDDPPLATPEVSVTAGSGITEGADASFTVSASPAPTAPLTVNVTVAQTGDFGVSTGSRSVTVPTSGSATVTVSTSDDDVDEPDGSVTATVKNGDGYTVSSTAGSASVVVSDDDDPPTDLPKVSVSDSSLVEGGAMRLMEFRLELSEPSLHNVTVRYEIVPGTVKPSDYYGGGGRVVIWANRTTASLYVYIRDDSRSERDETLFVELTAADGAVIADGTGVGTIIDDD
ncbi:MAG: PQQ-dependent sugar dehydrogenase [bacterium]|nr:PQQ-dependent sugar dehydrogenase [bacterium]